MGSAPGTVRNTPANPWSREDFWEPGRGAEGTRERREEAGRDTPRGVESRPWGILSRSHTIHTQLASLLGHEAGVGAGRQGGLAPYRADLGAAISLSPPSQWPPRPAGLTRRVASWEGMGWSRGLSPRGRAAWSGGLTFFLPSLPPVSGRLRHVCGQPQRRVSHARAAALAAPARGHQQCRGRRAPAGAAGVAPGPAAGGVPVHQHRARPGLRHLRGAEDPAGHLDRALPGRPSAPREGAGGRSEEHAAPLGGKPLSAQHLASPLELWRAKSLALGGGGGGEQLWGEPPSFSRWQWKIGFSGHASARCP